MMDLFYLVVGCILLAVIAACLNVIEQEYEDWP